MVIVINNWLTLDSNIQSRIKCDIVLPFDMSNIDTIDHSKFNTYIYIDDMHSQYRVNPGLLLIVKTYLERRGKNFIIHAYFKDKEFVDVPRLKYYTSLESLLSTLNNNI